MALSFRIAQIADLEEILDYEQKKLLDSNLSEEERVFSSWNARWRRESLEHYLPLGWSFVARDPEVTSAASEEGQLMGYFLGQPLLFFEGQTQCLWVEHLQFTTLQARDELCDLAYRLSREKHFQKVLFPENHPISNSVRAYRSESWKPSVLSVNTTKVSQ